MTVRRDALLEESMVHFQRKAAQNNMLRIVYNGEGGYDAGRLMTCYNHVPDYYICNNSGGLRRGWFTDIAQELFDPRFGLFKVSANKRSIQPNPVSAFFPDFEKYFEFAGAFVAKVSLCSIVLFLHALFRLSEKILQLMYISTDASSNIFLVTYPSHFIHQYSLDFFISGKNLTLNDLEDLDPALTKSLKWMLENNVEALMQDFTYEVDVFESRITKELKPNGANILVDESNKKEYVKLVALAKMRDEIAPQIKYFKHGFYKVIPQKELSLFSENDINLLIAGEPEVNIDDMQKHSTVYGFTGGKDNQMVIWFWEIVRTFDSKALAALLYFSSGKIFSGYSS